MSIECLEIRKVVQLPEAVAPAMTRRLPSAHIKRSARLEPGIKDILLKHLYVSPVCMQVIREPSTGY